MCIGRKFKVVEDKFRKYPEVEIILPQRGTSLSSSYDFKIPCDVIVPPNSRVLVWSDIKAYMESDEELELRPRSSLGIKGLILSNIIGVIDSDYVDNPDNNGNIGLSLWNTTNQPFFLKAGDKVCQGIFHKYLITNDDKPVSEQRKGGIGSTGKS